MQDLLRVDPEVADAIRGGRGVVALESTIITHGMPHPTNVDTAMAVEEAVRAAGATPATIAVVDGQLCVGLSQTQLERVAHGENPLKVSRRDLAFVLSRGAIGGTTVAATMIIANMAGVDVFATGGIGGVHRGAETSFDISADLEELAKTDVTVVSAGFKSILDLGLTLEYLETRGVPVIGFGTNELPAFYTRESGFTLDQSARDASEVADIIGIRKSLGLGGGVVVANPIPAEHEMDRGVIDGAISQAVQEAEAAGIGGKELTPYLLGRIVELTGKVSLEANVQLILNNARVAGAIAVALAGLDR